MKRITAIILTLIMALALSACADNNNTNSGHLPSTSPGTAPSDIVLTARIMQIYGNSLLLANISEDANASDLYMVPTDSLVILSTDGSDVDKGALASGMIVEVAYDGVVMESYPMQLGNPSSIEIKDQGTDLMGFYKQVIDELYSEDTGLNDSISVLAFDLTGIVNLTGTEKSALVYVLGNAYGMESLQGTFDELCEQGYIDKEKLFFKSGLLFELSDTLAENNSFTFDISKWRSGLGAIGMQDCKAMYKDGVWTYIKGGMWIS